MLRSAVQTVFGIAFMVALAAMIVGLIRWKTSINSTVEEAQAWPEAEARVTGWRPQRLAPREPNFYLGQWSVVVEYVFEAQGAFFSGAFCLGQWVQSEEECSLLAAPWLNRKIRIRYAPKDPAKSIFLESDGAPPGTLPSELQSQHDPQEPITLALK
jgi:hypothetical protein